MLFKTCIEAFRKFKTNHLKINFFYVAWSRLKTLKFIASTNWSNIKSYFWAQLFKTHTVLLIITVVTLSWCSRHRYERPLRISRMRFILLHECCTLYRTKKAGIFRYSGIMYGESFLLRQKCNKYHNMSCKNVYTLSLIEWKFLRIYFSDSLWLPHLISEEVKKSRFIWLYIIFANLIFRHHYKYNYI